MVVDHGGSGLSSLVLFQDCTEDELRRVAPLTRRRKAAAGVVVLEQGQQVDHLLLVLHGTVEIARDSIRGTLGSGDLIGEISVLTGEPASATVTVVEDAELLTIEAAHLPALLAMPTVGPRLRAIAKARVEARSVVTAASVPVIRKPPRVRGPGAGLHAGRRAHPARTAVLSLVALVVVGATTFILTQRNKSTVVGIDDLLAHVDLVPPAPAAGGATAEPEPVSPGTSASPTAQATEDAPQPAVNPTQAGELPAEPTGRPSVTDGGASPAPPDPSGPDFTPPAEGIYTYATEGSERISIAGASHQYPKETFAVVQRSSVCDWKLEHHVLREHVDHRSFCSGAETVTVLSFTTEVTFFGQTDGLTYVCDPAAEVLIAGAAPGTTATGICSSPDDDGQAHYTGRFIGHEPVTVGGQTVSDAVHLSIDFEMTGSARGTSHLEQWLDPTTGMILRLERTVDTLADSVWGDVRYQEEATFHLASLEPRR